MKQSCLCDRKCVRPFARYETGESHEVFMFCVKRVQQAITDVINRSFFANSFNSLASFPSRDQSLDPARMVRLFLSPRLITRRPNSIPGKAHAEPQQ